jgi:hypothetical protein
MAPDITEEDYAIKLGIFTKLMKSAVSIIQLEIRLK